MQDLLLSAYNLGDIELKNRVVMAPMTRSRAIGNIPNEMMTEYYSQRSSAGLIITEGTSPSPNGLGYSRIPGLYNDEQLAGWKKIADKVHANNGKIFIQLMHTGRVGHPLNLPVGAKILGPSAIATGDNIWTDQEQLQQMPVPQEMTTDDIETAVNEYVYAAKLAVEAGFDGVELHGANGYLIEQFLYPSSNQRNDEYGGSVENRIKFAIEVAKKVADEIGQKKVGIRLSPYGKLTTPVQSDEVDATYTLLSKELEKLGIAYIHVTDNGAPVVKELCKNVKRSLRKNFTGTIILSGGYNAQLAEIDLMNKTGDLVAFARPFIANPNFVEKIKSGKEIITADHKFFFSPGAEGYIDYPSI